MPCVPIKDGVLCVGGPTRLMPVRGRMLAFELHSYCGPLPVSIRTGEPVTRFASRHFYDAFDRWRLGGEVLAEDGVTCVPPPWCSECDGLGQVVVERVGRHCRVRPCGSCSGRRIQAAEAAGGD